MTNEKIYDTEIAPKLLEIAERCQVLGFPMVAAVEWENSEGNRGRTEFCPSTNDPATRPTAAQLLVHYAARSNGNVDALIMGIIKDARKFGHSSLYLQMLDVPTTPTVLGVPENPIAAEKQ